MHSFHAREQNVIFQHSKWLPMTPDDRVLKSVLTVCAIEKAKKPERQFKVLG
jgi:hypothetical protein